MSPTRVHDPMSFHSFKKPSSFARSDSRRACSSSGRTRPPSHRQIVLVVAPTNAPNSDCERLPRRRRIKPGVQRFSFGTGISAAITVVLQYSQVLLFLHAYSTCLRLRSQGPPPSGRGRANAFLRFHRGGLVGAANKYG